MSNRYSSAVLELQSEIANDSVGIGVICKKAHLIAKKLKQDQIIGWLNFELNGYEFISDIPIYRKIRIEPKFNNPYRGLCPILIAEGPLKKCFDNYPIGQSILSIDSLIANKESDLVLHLPAKLETHLREALKDDMGFDFQVLATGNIISMTGIADTVKMKIMDWLLDLEQNGVLGENLIFTGDEIKMASGPTQNFYNSTIGVMAHASNDAAQNISVTQTVTASQVEKLISDILPSLSLLPDEEGKDIKKQLLIAEVEAQAGNISKAKLALGAAKRIAEGIAGNVTAAGIVTWLASII